MNNKMQSLVPSKQTQLQSICKAMISEEVRQRTYGEDIWISKSIWNVGSKGDDRRRSWSRLQVEVCYNTEAITSTSHREKYIWILSRSSVDIAPVCKNNI